MSFRIDQLFMLSYFFCVVICDAAFIPSIAACESSFTLNELFDGVASISDHTAASSALVDDGHLDILPL